MLMSTAKKINESPSIDIGPGTPVLALDSSGAVGKGTLPEAGWQKAHTKIFICGQWFRIAKLAKYSVGLMFITEQYYNILPQPIALGVSCNMYVSSYHNIEASINTLAGVNTHIALRCVREDDDHGERRAA